MKVLKFVKEYWIILSALGALAVYLIVIDTRIFDSSEQKVEVIKYVEDSPSPVQIAVDRVLDSIADDTHKKNDEHAMQTRQKRYEDGVKSDSIKRENDSLFLDMITRQTVQIEQMKSSIDSIKSHH